jgi:hypothetical protein
MDGFCIYRCCAYLHLYNNANIATQEIAQSGVAIIAITMKPEQGCSLPITGAH